MDKKTIYSFKEKDINGNLVDFNKYKGKVLLIVNVASKCGNTKQYKDLQFLYEKYKDSGFSILGFPCNQFFMQEPKSDDEIQQFCALNYGVTFDMFSKINVNGKEANDLYTYLKEQLPWTTRAKNVKWNFEKFLIDKNGLPRFRIENKINPMEIEDKIIELLKEK